MKLTSFRGDNTGSRLFRLSFLETVCSQRELSGVWPGDQMPGFEGVCQVLQGEEGWGWSWHRGKRGLGAPPLVQPLLSQGAVAEHVMGKQRPWEAKLDSSLAKPNSAVPYVELFLWKKLYCLHRNLDQKGCYHCCVSNYIYF